MPQIGPLEILVVGVLALLVFGPEKLPEMARTVGKGMAQMKSMASDMKSEFDLGHEERSTTVPSSEPSDKAETNDESAEPPIKASAASE